MKRTVLAGLLSALAFPALAQFTFQAGNYTTSITGATFVHNGGAIPGLSTGEVAQCGSSHIHAVIPGFGNPNTTCGHGTPIFLSPLSVAPSGATSNSAASMLSSSSSVPNSAAGQLAITRPGIDAATAGELFLFAFGAATGSPLTSPGTLPRAKDELNESLSNWDETLFKTTEDTPPTPVSRTSITFDPFAAVDPVKAQRDAEIAREDVNITLYGTPRPTPEQLAKGPDMSALGGGLRDGAPKPPAAPPAANPPAETAQDGQPSGSILDSLEEPKPGDLFKAMDAPLPESEKTRDDHNKADKEVNKIFSGTPQESDTAKKLLPFQPPEVRRLIERKINERVRRIVLDATSAAVGAPRAAN